MRKIRFKTIFTLLLALLLCVVVTGCGTKRQPVERWIIEEIQKDEMYANWDIEVYNITALANKDGKDCYKVEIHRDGRDNDENCLFVDTWIGSIDYKRSLVWKYPSRADIIQIDFDFVSSKKVWQM